MGGYPGSSGSSGYPGSSGSSGYPGSSEGSPPGYGPGGYGPPGSSGGPPPGYPPGSDSSGQSGSTAPSYPPGYDPRGENSSGEPGPTTPPGYGPQGGYPGAPGTGSDGGYGAAAAEPPKPKTLRDKATAAFREGNEEEAFELLMAHYLTTPGAGSELARNMQWASGLRKPALATRFGVAVIYTAPFNWEGHPQPLGSAELEAALEEIGGNTGGNQGAGGGERRGNARAFGGGRNRNREGRGGGARAPMGPMGPMGPPGGLGLPGGESGMQGAQGQPQTAQDELEYFTGELGTKLLAKLKTKLEAGTFGIVLKEANKAMPLREVNENQPGNPGGPGFDPGRGVGIAPPMGPGVPGRPGGGPPGPGVRPGAGEGGDEAIGGPVLTGQLIPGVTFLGACENVKELGELVADSPVNVVFVFEVKVRPASASNWVNNDTRLRVVSAAKVNENLFTSSTINNKGVYEMRKKKGGEDPVNKELTEALDVVEQRYKMEPLLASVTGDVALNRIKNWAASKPDDALPLLLEARYYVAKKLIKPEDLVTVVMTEVGEDQLGNFSRHLDGDDVKERIATALKGNTGDRPKTVLGKFGDALMGAGGIGNLVPTPELPPIGLPGSTPPGSTPGATPTGVAPGSGPPRGPGSGYGPGYGPPMPGAAPAATPGSARGGLAPQGPGAGPGTGPGRGPGAGPGQSGPGQSGPGQSGPGRGEGGSDQAAPLSGPPRSGP
jgi:hypothetical protein